MSKSKKKRHYMEDQLDIMRSIRKKMPRPTKVVTPDRDCDKPWDWRKEITRPDDV